MIDLYTWPTPNGHKIHIMLEETGLAYNVIPIDIGAGDQFDPDFLKISPNNKMPAMVDHDGPGGAPYPMFESGALLMYLAEKTGRFMPSEITARYRVIQWLMFQMGHIGPMLGQAHHFRAYAPEQIPYAVDRYTNEASRLYRVCETRLAQSEQQHQVADDDQQWCHGCHDPSSVGATSPGSSSTGQATIVPTHHTPTANNDTTTW